MRVEDFYSNHGEQRRIILFLPKQRKQGQLTTQKLARSTETEDLPHDPTSHFIFSQRSNCGQCKVTSNQVFGEAPFISSVTQSYRPSKGTSYLTR